MTSEATAIGMLSNESTAQMQSKSAHNLTDVRPGIREVERHSAVESSTVFVDDPCSPPGHSVVPLWKAADGRTFQVSFSPCFLSVLSI